MADTTTEPMLYSYIFNDQQIFMYTLDNFIQISALGSLNETHKWEWEWH